MHIRATRSQSDLICAPQPVIAEESPAIQNGGYTRGLPRWLDHIP
jgi:hypothetical protein